MRLRCGSYTGMWYGKIYRLPGWPGALKLPGVPYVNNDNFPTKKFQISEYLSAYKEENDIYNIQSKFQYPTSSQMAILNFLSNYHTPYLLAFHGVF